MKPSHLPSARRRQSGSALVTVLLFSFMLLTLAGSVMQWSLSERRLNARSGYWLEARNAAEAVAEYGCYQVAQAFNSSMNPTFGSGGVTISFPSTLAATFFSGSHVSATSLDLRAGTVTRVPATSLYYVNPADPNNRFDPLVGRYVYRRDVTILSRATATPPVGGGPPVTSYIMEKVSVRGAPLFAYAIFYSGNDLEVNPLPQMDIYGPVHVNGNLFVGSVSNGVTLNFHGPVSASGNVYHAWRGVTSVAQQGSTMSSSSGVYFPIDSTGNNLANMRTAGGNWNDSTMGADSSTNGLNNLIPLVTAARTTAFSQYASQTWRGNLQTAAMGIQSYNPMGFSEIVARNSTTNTDILATDDAADDGSVVGTGAGYGHGYGPHALIEPAMALAASTDPYKIAKDAIEEQKFARKAGLYIKVQVDASNNLVGTTLYGDPRSAPTGTPPANIGPNAGIRLGTSPGNVLQYIKYTTTGTGTSTVVNSGMYDKHQSKGVNLVQINMAALKTALIDMTGSTTTAGTDILAADNVTKWGLGAANGYDKYTPASTGWNGGIYVEVVSAATTTHTAVVLSNGTVVSGSSLVPAVNGVRGLTVATNAPVYILGHFNANGTIGSVGTSNSALYPDDSASGIPLTASTQSPVAVAGDAVTILSPNYFGTAGTTMRAPASQTAGSAFNSFKTANPTASVGTEVAAALISGSNTTSATSSGTQEYSGGVHNMPRFLENWSGKTVAIRGSLVSMYNTRVATAIWGSSYYSPPNRQWGFDQLFANGTFPPIIPTVISYRRVDFSYLDNAAAYAAEISRL